jgi:hypothetical protein
LFCVRLISAALCGLALSLLPCSLLSNSFEEFFGGFIVGVSGDEFAFEGSFQDALAQPFGLLEAVVNGFFDLVSYGEAALDFRNDAVLLS